LSEREVIRSRSCRGSEHPSRRRFGILAGDIGVKIEARFARCAGSNGALTADEAPAGVIDAIGQINGVSLQARVVISRGLALSLADPSDLNGDG